jgi:hypothetical protein
MSEFAIIRDHDAIQKIRQYSIWLLVVQARRTGMRIYSIIAWTADYHTVAE